MVLVKKLSKVLVLMMLALLMVLLVSSPVKADWWGPPTQLTSNTATDAYPSISGDGSKVAFESNVDGDYEVFVVNSDGTGLQQQPPTQQLMSILLLVVMDPR